jgi:hypothetical protein
MIRMIPPRSLVVVALWMVGCGQYRTLELPAEPAHSRTTSLERDGLVVAAELVSDPRVAELYLGRGFHEAGFFAVVVHFENRGTSSFEIEREDFSVVLESGERFEPLPPSVILEELRRSPVNVASVLLGPLIFPVFLIAQDARDHNFELARNLHEKGLHRARRVERGDPPLSKVLFFREASFPQDGAGRFDSSVLEFVAEIEGAQPDATPEEAVTVGKRVTFTTTLSRKEI